MGGSCSLAIIGLTVLLLSGGCVEPLAPVGGDSPGARRGAALSSAKHGRASRPWHPPGATKHAAPSFVDNKSGISFRVPTGLELEAEHFDSAGPVGQMRHRLVLFKGKLERLSVEIWDNPTSLPVGAWFEEHLAFVRDGHAVINWAMVSGHRVRGMLIRQPRSPQAFGQRMAIFSAGGRVVRVTCQNEDDAATLAAFRQVVASITVMEGV